MRKPSTSVKGLLRRRRPRGLGGLGLDVVEVQHGVEQQVELAEVLPPVARVAREHDDAPLARRLIDDRRPIPDLVRAAHQAAEHVIVAAGVTHQHASRGRRRRRGRAVERVGAGLHGQQRPAAVADRDRLLVVAVEDRVVRLQDLRVDDCARRVKRRGRTRGVDLRRQPELGGEEARCAQRDQHTASLGEPVQFGDALDAHAAGDVVRFAVHPEVLELLALLVGDRRAP